MSDQELREALREFINQAEIDDVLNRIRASDLTWFTQIDLRFDPLPIVRFKVAVSDEDGDCKALTIVQGKPIYPT